MALGIVCCSNAAAGTTPLNRQKKKGPEKLGVLVSSGGRKWVVAAKRPMPPGCMEAHPCCAFLVLTIQIWGRRHCRFWGCSNRNLARASERGPYKFPAPWHGVRGIPLVSGACIYTCCAHAATRTSEGHCPAALGWGLGPLPCAAREERRVPRFFRWACAAQGHGLCLRTQIVRHMTQTPVTGRTSAPGTGARMP